MRKLLIMLILAIMAKGSHAQEIIGKMYTIMPDFIQVYGVDKSNHIIDTAVYRASKNTKFTVTGFDSAHNIKITFWRYYKESEKTTAFFDSVKNKSELYNFSKTKGYIGRWANYKEFVIKPEVFSSSCIPYYGSKNEFTWGVMTLPIKLRTGDSKNRYFSYEESLNLGFVFGLRHQLEGKTKHSLNYLMGLGIANVRTDSLSLKSGITPASSNSAAFSANVGALYAHNNFQIGLFIGTDYIPGTLGRDWKYQGKPWFGLAVGISLFSNTDSQGGEGKNDDNGKDSATTKK